MTIEKLKHCQFCEGDWPVSPDSAVHPAWTWRSTSRSIIAHLD